MKTSIVQSVCPACGEVFEMATNMFSSRGPAPGDVSICVECGSCNIFTEGLGQRPATNNERTMILNNPKAQMMLEGLKQVVWKKRRERAS